MSTQNTEIMPAPSPVKAAIAIGNRGIEFTDLDSLWRFSTAVSKSGLAPKGIQTPEAITVAIQMGLEVGLTPMSALQNIAVINGRPSIWGDAQLAIVRSTGKLELFEEWYEQGGKRLQRNPSTYTDDTTAVCRSKREGYAPSETSFSVADSKLAKLWGKEGPWSQYPARMLKFRARSFNLRDGFGDALKGLLSAEEAQDLPIMNVTPVVKQARTVTVESILKQVGDPTAKEPTVAKPDPWMRLGEILESKGFTVPQFVECMVGDGKLFGADPSTILTIDDIPKSAAVHYVGADFSGSEAIRSINFVTENKAQ
jgi:hypothetical protein